MFAAFAAALTLTLIALANAFLPKEKPCPNCGAPLRRDGTAYYCAETHCGYHS